MNPFNDIVVLGTASVETLGSGAASTDPGEGGTGCLFSTNVHC